MKGCLSILVATALSLPMASLHGDTITWNNSGGGNWSDSSNWTPNLVPGTNDIAIITNSGNYSVTLDVAANVGGLILGAGDSTTQTFLINGQIFSLAGQATVNSGGQINLSSGVFNGNTNSGAVFVGTLTPSGGLLAGTITFASNAVLNLSGIAATNTLSSLLVLTNYGTVNWSNTGLYGASGFQIFNYGLWDAQTNDTFYGGPGGGTTTFDNYGTFCKSGGNQTSLDNNTLFNNSGTVDVQIGTLAIEKGIGTGVFNVSNNAVINFGGSSGYTLEGNPAFAGSGIVSGNLAGGDPIINGTLTCSAITLTGKMTISNTCVMNFVGTLGSNVFSCNFNNYGTVIWSNSDLYGLGGTISNDGLWDAKTNGTFWNAGPFGYYYAQTTFNNVGTFRKSGGGGNTTFDSKDALGFDFDNSGTVDIESGNLLFQNAVGGSVNGGNGGTFYAAGGTTINFTGAYYILRGSNSFTGDGTVLGTLQGGSGNTPVITGTMTFSDISFAGFQIIFASNAIVNFVGTFGPISIGLPIINYGTVNWSNADLICSASPQIDNYGLWNAQNNNTFSGGADGGTTTFNNYGTFRKSGGTYGTGETYLDNKTIFNNSGAVDIQTGLLAISGDYTLTGGILNFGINNSNDFGSLDLFNLSGNAPLSGTLSANLNNGYSPGLNNSFALITYGSETGTFANLNLPNLSSGLIWQANYGASAFTLAVAIPSPQLSPVTTYNGANFYFSWNAVPGQVYQAQYTTNLVPAIWFNLGNPTTATNTTMTIFDTIGSNPQRFYRVISP